MERRAGVGHEIGVLDDEKIAGSVGPGDFEGERAIAEGVRMAESVRTGSDTVDDGNSWRFGRALREDILESHGGEEGRGGFEECAALDGHGGMVRQGIGNRKQISVIRQKASLRVRGCGRRGRSRGTQ